jgi:ubiquinone/menaquinone biosynthesis C-methylase UbiE
MKSPLFQNYILNSKKILNSYNNPLKKKENLKLKDRLEKEFYDNEAKKYLNNFNAEVFLYDKDESMPLSHRYFYSLLNNINDRKILDCCCGHGFTSVRCAKAGAKVSGIDISPKMIKLANKNAEFNSISHSTSFGIMSVQELGFTNERFDYAVGIGALHHLNLELAGKEISRVLKPGGKAIFLEPKIPFKWLIFVRSLLPNKCYESPGGSQLDGDDISIFSSYFSKTHVKYFVFLKKISRFPILNKIEGKLEKIDTVLINRLPFLKKFYWAFVLEVTK